MSRPSRPIHPLFDLLIAILLIVLISLLAACTKNPDELAADYRRFQNKARYEYGCTDLRIVTYVSMTMSSTVQTALLCVIDTIPIDDKGKLRFDQRNAPFPADSVRASSETAQQALQSLLH